MTPTVESEYELVRKVEVPTNGNGQMKNLIHNIIQAIIIASIVGGITMYGLSQRLDTKIDMITKQLDKLELNFMRHIEKEKGIILR